MSTLLIDNLCKSLLERNSPEDCKNGMYIRIINKKTMRQKTKLTKSFPKNMPNIVANIPNIKLAEIFNRAFQRSPLFAN